MSPSALRLRSFPIWCSLKGTELQHLCCCIAEFRAFGFLFKIAFMHLSRMQFSPCGAGKYDSESGSAESGCTTKESYQESPPEERPARVFQKSCKRVSHRIVLQKFCTRESYKSVFQECPTKDSHKSILQQYCARMPLKSFPQDCSTRLSCILQTYPTRVSCKIDCKSLRQVSSAQFTA